MKKYAIIVAGGKGQRMNADFPKQFLPIGGSPVLMHSLSAFYKYDSEISIVLVLPLSEINYWKKLCETYHFDVPHEVVSGGETRFHSVKNGLALVPESCLVAVHDGVRPFASQETIARCYEKVSKKKVVIPVVEVFDSLRFVEEDNNKSVSRSDFRLVQTPQVFQSSLLKKAYEQEYTALFTDDASVVEAIGEKVFLVDGNRENIKITTPFDLEIAEVILKNRNNWNQQKI